MLLTCHDSTFKPPSLPSVITLNDHFASVMSAGCRNIQAKGRRPEGWTEGFAVVCGGGGPCIAASPFATKTDPVPQTRLGVYHLLFSSIPPILQPSAPSSRRPSLPRTSFPSRHSLFAHPQWPPQPQPRNRPRPSSLRATLVSTASPTRSRRSSSSAAFSSMSSVSARPVWASRPSSTPSSPRT
jgi:hypothetical protein